MAFSFLLYSQDCRVKSSRSGNEYRVSSVTHLFAGMTFASSLSQARRERSSLNQDTGILTTTNIKRLVDNFFNNVTERSILPVG